MFFTIDVWLLEKCERFSHWWQRLFGNDCFWLARMCTIFYALSILLCEVGALWQEHITAVMLPWLLLVSPFTYKRVCKIEELVLRMQDRGLANPFKIMGQELRVKSFILAVAAEGGFLLIFIGVAPHLSFVFSLVGLGIFCWYILLNYFVSCDPLPPAKSKIGEWMESWSEKRAPEPLSV